VPGAEVAQDLLGHYSPLLAHTPPRHPHDSLAAPISALASSPSPPNPCPSAFMWTVFAVICGRSSQVGRCGCFQMCFGPFPVGGGVSQARANALWPKLETVDFRSQRCGVWPVRKLSNRRERTECTTIRPS
jgi:hypothetical protein